MRLALADGDATNRAQNRMQNRFVIIFLVDDVADRARAGELQDEGVHPADMIRHKKKAAGWQVFQTERSDPIKAAHQRPSKEIERAFSGGHLEVIVCVILSEAKNLWTFLHRSDGNKSEMFRFAQHDSAI